MDSLRGQLLLASPRLVDPNFRRTVVLVVEHHEEGALGLVLNRQLELEVGEGAQELAQLVEDGARVHRGGPVEPSRAVVLAEFEDPDAAGLLVLGSIGLPPADMSIEELAVISRRARVFAGHSGWGPAQLDGELAAEDWIVASAEPDDVFTGDTDSLWSAVLERKGGRYALLARMPVDPRLN